MIHITLDQRKKLKRYVPGLKDILAEGDVNKLVMAMEEALPKTLDRKGEATKKTEELSRLLDFVIMQNEQ